MKKTTLSTPLSSRFSIFISLMLAFLFVLNAVSYMTIRRFDEAAAVRRDTLQTMASLERSLGSLNTIQSALRGFVMAEDRSYQESYSQAVVQLNEALKEVAVRAVSLNSSQRLSALSQLAGQEIAFSRQVLDLYDRPGVGAARSLLATGRGDAVIERARSVVAVWRGDLEKTIYRADERLAGAGRQVRIFLAFGSILAAFLCFAGGMALWRSLRDRERTGRDLARLADVVATCDDAIISETLDGRILTWNKGAQQIYGFGTEETIGRQLSVIVPVTHQKEVREMLARVGGGERLRHFQTKRLTKDGRLIDVSLTVSPLYDAAGCIYGVSTISHDITEQKKMEEEVRRAIEIRSRFIAIASHELRSPLTAIREGIALIAEGLRGPVSPGQIELLAVALRNIDRLSRLSKDILDFEKIESGQLRLIPAWHDLCEILDDVVKTVRPLADEKGLALTVDVDEGLPRVVCDKDKVIQVLLNLVNNAVKFTKAGSVKIEVRKDFKALQVSVRDTGPGIAEEDKPLLFQSFQQFGAPSEQEGSGLGLFIARQIVQAHGGRIWAESEGGRGSAFRFTLPLK